MENKRNPPQWSDNYGHGLTGFGVYDDDAFTQYAAVLDPSLESAFAGLTLAGEAPPLPASALSHSQTDLAFLQQLRVRDAVNGQTDPSFGSRNLDLTAGVLPSWAYPMSGMYTESDLWRNQQYIGMGANYMMPPELSVSQSPNRRRSFPQINQYNSGYNRHRSIDVPNVPLRYLRGNIVNVAKSQPGCKLLQAHLEAPTEEDVDLILGEILYRLHEIMCDQFGNYVFQKLVKVANERQRIQIAHVLGSSAYHLVAICVNQYGTRAVQKFLETNITPQQISIVMQALRHGAVTLSTDANGHHVIQHCLKRFSLQDNLYLISELKRNCFEISTSKSGCCVMQSCVDNSRGEIREQIILEIINNSVLLAEDPYGNYVLQHLLDLKIREVSEDLLKHLEGYYVSLSSNKYASNVVQKCMEETEDDQSLRVIMECLNSPNVSRLLNDPYGNYVIQTALKRFKGNVLGNLLNLIKSNAGSMRNNMYGKKILDLVQEMRLYRG